MWQHLHLDHEKAVLFRALQARGKMLRLNTLRYADEVVSVGSLELGKTFPCRRKN